jgi:hypothetical protein
LPARAVFECPILLLSFPKKPFRQNLHYFFAKAFEIKMGLLHISNYSFDDTKQKLIKKIWQLELFWCAQFYYFLQQKQPFLTKSTLIFV